MRPAAAAAEIEKKQQLNKSVYYKHAHGVHLSMYKPSPRLVYSVALVGTGLCPNVSIMHKLITLGSNFLISPSIIRHHQTLCSIRGRERRQCTQTYLDWPPCYSVSGGYNGGQAGPVATQQCTYRSIFSPLFRGLNFPGLVKKHGLKLGLGHTLVQTSIGMTHYTTRRKDPTEIG